MSVPPGTTDEDAHEGKLPAKALLKRIDIGLTTGLAALVLSFVGILTSRATLKMNQDTQKARVLPIVEVDMGYQRLADNRYDFAVTLTNSGVGLAHIQRVEPVIGGERVEGYQAFEDAVMNRRMRGWARVTDGAGTGYLRPGESRRAIHYAMNGASREVDAYLRGQFGTPYSDMDIEACYCSVFEDCWTTSFRDRSVPQPVADCGTNSALTDVFADYRDQRAAARANTDD